MFLLGRDFKFGNIQNVRNVRVNFRSDSIVEMYVIIIKIVFIIDVGLGLIIFLYDFE